MVCGTQQDNSHSIREDRVKFFVHKGGVKGLDCIASDQSRPGFYKFFDVIKSYVEDLHCGL